MQGSLINLVKSGHHSLLTNFCIVHWQFNIIEVGSSLHVPASAALAQAGLAPRPGQVTTRFFVIPGAVQCSAV